ncbi:hypothetical protein C8J57DRAFT_1516476 [Mycena rebaudengoi]|nr:hypothetical protein C8J57DRAFT_1516476 [Mycena rebaudengoi]
MPGTRTVRIAGCSPISEQCLGPRWTLAVTKTEEWTLAVTKTTTEGTIGLTEIDSGLLAAYVDGNVAYHRPSSYPGCMAENTLPRAAGSPATTHFFSAHGPSTELGNLGTAPVFSRSIVPCGLFVTGLIYVLLAALAVFLARAYLRFLARAYLRTMAVFLDVPATCRFMLLQLGNPGTAPVLSRPIVPRGLFVTGLIYVLLAALAVLLARAYLRFWLALTSGPWPFSWT